MIEMPTSKTYQLLEAGPIVLVTTQQSGRPNVMTLGFHMMVQHAPPLIGCVVGPWDHSYKAFRKTSECVIAVPTVDLAHKVVDIGNCSGSDIDKFSRFELTAVKAAEVRAPLIQECFANIECRVVDVTLVGKYNLFILQAIRGFCCKRCGELFEVGDSEAGCERARWRWISTAHSRKGTSRPR